MRYTRPNQAMQRTASKAATGALCVCHPPSGCDPRFEGLAVADLILVRPTSSSADYERAAWHTDESWAIETLDWRNDPQQFERLMSHVTAQLEPEVSERGQRLFDIVTPEE